MQRPTNVRWIVLFGLCLAAGFAYIHRISLAPAAKFIRQDLSLSLDETGAAGSIFFWMYALFQIPAGIIVTRWGARRSMLLFGMMCAASMALSAGTLIAGSAAGTMVFGVSIGFIILFASRAFMGIAQAGLFPAATRSIATWFPLNRRASAAGTLQAFMSLGGAFGTIVIAAMLRVISWPWAFILLAIPAVIWSLWFYWWYRDDPAEHRSANQAERDLLRQPVAPVEEKKTPTPWLKLFTSPKLIWLCASQYFRAAAIAFWLVWCPTYLQSVYHLDPDDAGMLNSIPLIGVVLGSLFGGILADRVLKMTGSKRWSRNGVSVITAAVGICFFIAAYWIRSGPYTEITLLFVAALLTACGNPCSYSVSIDIGGKYLAIVFCTMNMIGNFGSATLPMVVPPWTRAFGWVAAPLLLALVFILGSICWLFINPNGMVVEEEKVVVLDS